MNSEVVHVSLHEKPPLLSINKQQPNLYKKQQKYFHRNQ